MERLLSNKKLLLPLFVFLFGLFFFLAYHSDGTFDAGDGIRHYLVSRYSWIHPEQFLYSWGKPFFTIISSPFSQFGLLGINVFNIFCGIVSAFICFKIGIKLKLKYPLLVVPFLFFTPCYFPTLNSGLTEPFFGLVLIVSIYLFFEKKYFFSVLLVSFLPFVRSEGNIIILLFFVMLLYRKKLWHLPLLAFGTFLYSVIGFFYYNDFFWIKNQNPYTGHNADIYGHGELLHFVKNHNFIWGTTLGVLFVAGCVAIFYALTRKKTAEKKDEVSSFLPEELVLIYGSFILYFVAHSIFWWKGLVGSLGLLRVMAAIAPCSAFICLRGFNLFANPLFKKFRLLEYLVIPVVLFFVIYSPFKHDYYPFRLDAEQTLLKQAGSWYKSSVFARKKVYYLYPYFAHVLDVDPFDPNKVGELWGLYPSIREWGIDAIPDSTVIFWDGHFGPNECRIPLDTIMNDPNFQLIKSFKPETPFTVLGGYFFEIHVFLKTNRPKKLTSVSHELFDLESAEVKSIGNLQTLTTEKAFSGKISSKLSAENEYSAIIIKQCDTLDFSGQTKKISFKAKISGTPDNYNEAIIVVSVDDTAGKNLYWDGKAITTNVNDRGEWKTIGADFIIEPNLLKVGNIIKLYIWNPKKKGFYIDDLELDFIGEAN
jgi:hypothetical protein